jgi:hypothetical protein
MPATLVRWGARGCCEQQYFLHICKAVQLPSIFLCRTTCKVTAKLLHLLLLLPPQGKAMGAVGCALSLVAASAGLRFAPLSLMAERVTAGLQVLAAKHRWGER